MSDNVTEIARTARLSSYRLGALCLDQRNEILQRIHDSVKSNKDKIMAANKIDLERAKDSPLAKRLDLSKNNVFDTMLEGVEQVIDIQDPLNQILNGKPLDDDLVLEKVTCPIGVILVIFEARPEVLVNVTALAIKSGNAVILKGGKECSESLNSIYQAMQLALQDPKYDEHLKSVFQLVHTHTEISSLLRLDHYIDLVIPRGGNELIKTIKAQTSIPVLGHADGLCSIYIAEDAEIDMAVKVVVDSKTQYPAACNACETVLIDKSFSTEHVTSLFEALMKEKVTLYCDPKMYSKLDPKISGSEFVKKADDAHFDTEFLGLSLAVKEVSGVDEAIAHINQHGSKHTDCIITNTDSMAKKFFLEVDSSSVYQNCSTRFADGFRYGFGAEVGISTNKIHSRGPVGLDGLVIYKYILKGSGNIVQDYVSGERQFKHSKN